MKTNIKPLSLSALLAANPSLEEKHLPPEKTGLSEEDLVRFWSRVKIGSLEQCWEWQSWAASREGYGGFRTGKLSWRSHRIAYQVCNGKIPDGMHILHRCDNPPCCNPFHLRAGTNLDNVNDRVRKGRSKKWDSRRGETSCLHVLAESQVLEILKDGRPERAIARAYGVSRGAISSIKLKRTWKHLHARAASLDVPEGGE